MDPISVAASIAGLVTLAASLAGVTNRFITGLRHAKDDAQILTDELTALQNILRKLEAANVEKGSPATLIPNSAILHSHSKALHKRFESLLKKLESVPHSTVGKLTWPIKREELTETITHIRAFGSLIHFALSVDTWSLLLSSSNDAKHLLAQQIESVEALNRIVSRTDALEEAVQRQTVVLENSVQEEHRRRLLSWLSDGAQETRHESVKKTRQPGTGQWLLDHSDFTKWADRHTGANLLWCPGDMGSGKTHLCSLVIDHLRKAFSGNDTEVAFFYFNYADASSQSMARVVGSLMRQILQRSARPIPTMITRLHEKHGTIDELSLKDLQASLLQVIDLPEATFLVFDAIDEVETTVTLTPFLDLIEVISSSSKGNICTTGRQHNPDLEAKLGRAFTISIKAHDEDLRRYIRSKLNDSSASAYLDDDEFQAEILNQLMTSAHGLFLLPALQLEGMLLEPTRGDMEDAMQSMPISLAGVLDKNIDRIIRQTPSRSSLGLSALRWLSSARRPLKSQELCDILSLDLSQRRALHEKYQPTSEMILTCCQGLVYLDSSRQTLHLVHLAIREHVRSKEHQLFGESIQKLACKSCLVYLLDDAFVRGPVEVPLRHPGTSLDDTELLRLLKKHTFLDYLSKNWSWHVQDCLGDPNVRVLLMKVLQSQARIGLTVQISRYLEGYRDMYWSLEHVYSFSSLHLASELGLTEIACELIDTGKAAVDCTSSIDGTPLITAASSNELETMKALLQRGADPYKANWYGNSLHCAAERNCLDTPRELLALGMDPNVQSPTKRTALSCTMDRDNVEAAELLLQYNAAMHYGTIGRTLKRSFLGEISITKSVDMLHMVVNGGHVRSDDRATAERAIEGMIGHGLSLDEASQLMKALEDQNAKAGAD